MRIAIVYDCLYPNTVGGAERWYRSLAERLMGANEVTYLTRKQWGAEGPQTQFETVAVSPAMPLYTESGRRRFDEPLLFGLGMFWHMLRKGGRYDAVHMNAFPYFSIIGVWSALRIRSALRFGGKRPPVIVDWFELWSPEYWREYLGGLGGLLGRAIQRICVPLPDRSFVFSGLHEQRLRALGSSGPITRLTGIYNGGSAKLSSGERPPHVMYAGRHIPEKHVTAIPPAVQRAARSVAGLSCTIFGDGPDHAGLVARVEELGLAATIELPGRVDRRQIDEALSASACLVLPSAREGYGLVVIEAIAQGTPAIVVAGADNAATELIEPGVNGFVAASAGPEDLGEAIVRAVEGGKALRESTLAWYREHETALSLENALDTVAAAYVAVGSTPS